MLHLHWLPPAYVVRLKGSSFTLLVCSHPGGYPHPIMLCNISQNAMGQPGGYPYPIMLCNISQNAMGQLGGYPARSSCGGTLPGPAGGYPGWGGTLARGVPWSGGTLAGGYPGWGGTLAGGYPGQVPPPSQVRMGGYPDRGGTQVGQQKEYSLHGGRYASCVHAGGLFCF